MDNKIIRIDDNPIEKHNAIEKALVILKLFSPYNQELGTIEISKLLGYHKATVSRTLLLLVKHGFLEQNAITKKFRLGPSVLNLGMTLHRSLQADIIHLAKPHMDQLRDQFRESIVLEILASKYVVIGYIAEGPKRIRLAGEIGDVLPPHITAGAKSILAFSTSQVREAFIHQHFDQLTSNTITDQIELCVEYEKIKQQGYSLDMGEHDEDINAIGAPIINYENNPVAAVVMAGLAKNIDTKKGSVMIEAVKHTAAEISNALYCEPRRLSAIPI